jgi:hypothetical protein
MRLSQNKEGMAVAKLGLQDNADLKAVLEHPRSRFEYHAKQRMDSLRYFLAAYVVIAGGYVTAGRASVNDSLPPYAHLVMALTALVVTLIFWGFDYRNAQIVNFDEDALKEVEAAVSARYELTAFQMTQASEMPNQWRRYHYLTRLLFTYFTLLSVFAVLIEVKRLLC